MSPLALEGLFCNSKVSNPAEVDCGNFKVSLQKTNSIKSVVHVFLLQVACVMYRFAR